MGSTVFSLAGDFPGFDPKLREQLVQRAEQARAEFGDHPIRIPVQMPRRDLSTLLAQYRDFVRTRLNPPWESTRTVLSYLKLEVVHAGFGAACLSTAPQLKFSFGMGFRDCGGTAGVSAELCAHWAARWYRCAREDFQPHFDAAGFVPAAAKDAEDLFFPFGEWGYARCKPAQLAATAPNAAVPNGLPFAVDESVLASLAPEDIAEIGAAFFLEHRVALAAGRCCCQLCVTTRQ